MQRQDFEQGKCNSGRNIQFSPKARITVDLNKFAAFLERQYFPIEIQTPSLLIFKVGGIQVDLNSSGKTIVKTESTEIARSVFSEIVREIGQCLK